MIKVTPGAADAIRLAGGLASAAFKSTHLKHAVADTFALGAEALQKGIGFEGREEKRVVRRINPRRKK